jgi:ferrous iron transport protein A
MRLERLDTMQPRARRLADLTPGESGKVSRVGGVAEVRHRLLEMGLTSGTPVRLVRVAPLGDPIELHVRGYRLSLRKAEAARVYIEGK